jgi:hypothetical protein
MALHVVTPASFFPPPPPPQQSVSFVQMSPTGLQPLAGWQMSTWVGP